MAGKSPRSVAIQAGIAVGLGGREGGATGQPPAWRNARAGSLSRMTHAYVVGHDLGVMRRMNHLELLGFVIGGGVAASARCC